MSTGVGNLSSPSPLHPASAPPVRRTPPPPPQRPMREGGIPVPANGQLGGGRPLPTGRAGAAQEGQSRPPVAPRMTMTAGAPPPNAPRPVNGGPPPLNAPRPANGGPPRLAPTSSPTAPVPVGVSRPPSRGRPLPVPGNRGRPLPDPRRNPSGLSRSLPTPPSRMTSLPVALGGRAASPAPVPNPHQYQQRQTVVPRGTEQQDSGPVAPPNRRAAPPTPQRHPALTTVPQPAKPSSETGSDAWISSPGSGVRRNISSSSYRLSSSSNNNPELKKSSSFYSGTATTSLSSSLSSSASELPTYQRDTASGDRKQEDAGKKERLRQEAVKELINTEQDYINDLELLNEVFLKPLASRSILEKQELAALFSNLEMLIGVNQEIMKELKEENADLLVGKVFLNVMHYFKMYTVYCANQPIALATFERCKTKNPAFASFLDECMADPRCRGLTLGSYLIKPIQRLCKYPLIIKTISQNTEENHEDYESLSEALKQMEKIVEYVNEGKRQAENSQKIIELQSNIEGGETLGLVQPTRRFLLESTIHVRMPKAKPRDRHCVLFNDLFLCAKHKKRGGGGYYDPFLLPLQVAKFIEISNTEEVQNSFELQGGGDKGETKSVVLVLPTPELKAEWAKEIKKIIRTYQKQRVLAAKKGSEEQASKSPVVREPGLTFTAAGSPSPLIRAPQNGRFNS